MANFVNFGKEWVNVELMTTVREIHDAGSVEVEAAFVDGGWIRFGRYDSQRVLEGLHEQGERVSSS